MESKIEFNMQVTIKYRRNMLISRRKRSDDTPNMFFPVL